MNIKGSIYYIGLIAAAIIVIFVFRAISPAPTPQEGRSDYLPDHITDITAPTLPRAVREARERGKQLVRVTDPAGNVIEASVDDVLQTSFRIDGEPLIVGGDSLGDAFNELVAGDEYFDDIRNLQIGEGEVTFDSSVVQYGDVAIIMYEMSVQLFKIRSTADWVIDII